MGRPLRGRRYQTGGYHANRRINGRLIETQIPEFLLKPQLFDRLIDNMLRTNGPGMLMIHRTHVHPLVIRGVCGRNRLRHNGPSGIAGDLSGIAVRNVFNLGRIDKQGRLTGDDLLDPVGQILPLFFGQGKQAPQIEHCPLPWTPFGAHGLHQLEGMVVLPVLLVGMGHFADIHGVPSIAAGSGSQGISWLNIRFWHYK